MWTRHMSMSTSHIDKFGRSTYSGLTKKGDAKHLCKAYNVVAYFDKFKDRQGKHYLPDNIQRVLDQHSSELFY